MKNKNQIAFLIILVAVAFATLAFVIWPTIAYGADKRVETAASSPDRVVQDFYDWYRSYESNPLVDHAYRSSEYLTQDMIAFLDDFTRDEMGYDPILCAQDKPSSVSPSVAQVSGGQASVEVTTSFEGHRFSVELVQSDGQWLIDKVNCSP